MLIVEFYKLSRKQRSFAQTIMEKGELADDITHTFSLSDQFMVQVEEMDGTVVFCPINMSH